MTHERCSELLGSFERGELEVEDARLVEEHLASCDECRQELAGLRALLATDYEPLREAERSALRTVVAKEVSAGRSTVTMFPARRTLWERHAGQIVGAAASLVVILFAVLIAQGIFAGDDGERGAARDSAVQERGAESAVPDGPAPVFAGAEPQPRAAAAEEDDSGAGGADQKAFRLNLQFRAAYAEKSLEQLGARGPIFREFAREYDAADAEAIAPGLLEQLADAAPNAAIADQIRECGTEILAIDPSRPLLPAFATSARYEGEPALIIGFVTAADAAGPLDQFSLYAWSEGSCGIPLTGLQSGIEGAS